ncbi:hypothetical protein RFI_28068 [Reticulomyxa filosa]|uniref:Uncharacterized protein n=1 Tax=Reticulomyxa filosa TaxID=46433 RepID=X6M770_RETFI|nr:hypothetical protein RFI_28068 [Reticulomyxa filosa]|eukprot:ETO09317.1 hypothetical protein RFI_28068 [Reticulomyxa filosa]
MVNEAKNKKKKKKLSMLTNTKQMKQEQGKKDIFLLLIWLLCKERNELLSVLISLFYLFLRVNTNGPILTVLESERWHKYLKSETVFPTQGVVSTNVNSELLCRYLHVDGEYLNYHHDTIHGPLVLVLVEMLTQFMLSQQTHVLSTTEQKWWRWWNTRITFVHQKLLHNPCPTLRSHIFQNMTLCQTYFSSDSTIQQDEQHEEKTKTKSELSLYDMQKCQFYIEYSIMVDYYWQHESAQRHLKEAKQCLEQWFEYELTAKLGKRTKWQSEDKSQLYLNIKRCIQQNQLQANDKEFMETTWFLPKLVALDDDTLLDSIRFAPDKAGEEEKTSKVVPPTQKLHYLELCILLQDISRIAQINRVKELTNMEIVTYLDRMISAFCEDTNNRADALSSGNTVQLIQDYCVQVTALWKRSMIEFIDKHKMTRAVQQLEAILLNVNTFKDSCRYNCPDQYKHVIEKFSKPNYSPEEHDLEMDEWTCFTQQIAWKRIQGVFGCNQSFRIAFELEFADLHFNLGFLDTALFYYQRLKVFHKIVKCHVLKNEKAKAEQLIGEQMQQIDLDVEAKLREQNNGKTNEKNSPVLKTVDDLYAESDKAYYLCLLGEVNENIEYFKQAWQVSKGKYGLAQRQLAKHYFKHRQVFKLFSFCFFFFFFFFF